MDGIQQAFIVGHGVGFRQVRRAPSRDNTSERSARLPRIRSACARPDRPKASGMDQVCRARSVTAVEVASLMRVARFRGKPEAKEPFMPVSALEPVLAGRVPSFASRDRRVASRIPGPIGFLVGSKPLQGASTAASVVASPPNDWRSEVDGPINRSRYASGTCAAELALLVRCRRTTAALAASAMRRSSTPDDSTTRMPLLRQSDLSSVGVTGAGLVDSAASITAANASEPVTSSDGARFALSPRIAHFGRSIVSGIGSRVDGGAKYQLVRWHRQAREKIRFAVPRRRKKRTSLFQPPRA